MTVLETDGEVAPKTSHAPSLGCKTRGLGPSGLVLLDGLTVDYDLYVYDAAGNQLASSTSGGATADQALWTDTSASAVNVDVRVHRYPSTRTTCRPGVSY